MSTFSVSLPDSIFQRVGALASEDGVPVNSFVATVLCQRVAVADADSYVRARVRRGSAEKMLELLAEAPAVEPEARDRLITAAKD